MIFTLKQSSLVSSFAASKKQVQRYQFRKIFNRSFSGYFKSVTSERPSTSVTDEEVLICRLLKHFLECIQFNTHTVESIFENRMVAWDTETRLWKSSQRC